MLYHVSNTGGIKVLKPKISSHKKPYVYAVDNIVTGLHFGAPHDDFDFLIYTDENGKPVVNNQGESMKKIRFMLLCILIMTFMVPSAAYGDIGPKPSVVIDFEGLEGSTYYVTLLSNVKSTGPFSVIKEDNKDSYRYQEGDKDYNIFLKFAEYKDKDSFYFLQYFKECTETHQFVWSYYPPHVFKILLYFPDTDSFIISDRSYERYAFDSYFTAKVSGTEITVEKSYDYKGEIISLIVRFALTFMAELGIAFLFDFRERKQVCFIMLVNVITQIMLNFTLNVINYLSGEMAFVIIYILLELLVFITEAVLYKLYLKRISIKEIPNWKPGLYAFVGNAVSFILGIILAYRIPGIF